MGHSTLKNLPRYPSYLEVIAQLEGDSVDVAQIAKASLQAVKRQMTSEHTVDIAADAFYVLVKLACAGRKKEYDNVLEELGIKLDKPSSPFLLTAEIGEYVRKRYRGSSASFREIAVEALQNTVTNIMVETLPSLFEASTNDIALFIKSMGKERTFEQATRSFFASFVAKTISFVVDHELGNVVGLSAFGDNNDAAYLLHNIDTYTHDIAIVVEEFSGGWLGKTYQQMDGNIGREESKKFATYALKKLRKALEKTEGWK